MKLQTCIQEGAGEDEAAAVLASAESRGRGPAHRGLGRFPLTSTSAAPPECDYPGIVRAIEKINNEYSRPLTVSSLARECGMSVRSLHRLYRAVTGTTIGRDLVARRLEAAAEMLREDDVKLEPVAIEAGLRNAKNLCRLFKEHVGVTPGQWKESVNDQTAGTTCSRTFPPA